MKTTKKYIAIATLCMAFSGGFAQNLEGRGSSNSDYLIKREADKQQSETIAQNSAKIETPVDHPNRLVAAQLINYQAVARDAGGVLMTNVPLSIDFEIRDGAGGPAVYNETQNLNTDANGVFSAQIGSVNSLASVNWLEIDAWLQVDLNGTYVGETQMGSVPTALHSKNSGAVMIYGSGTSNPDKMIAQHSPAYPGWGIGYSDVGDDIDFIAGGTTTARIDLGTGNISTNGSLKVLQTTTSPAPYKVYGNSMPIAFAKIDGLGGIDSGYGITSVVHEATGTYLITVDNPAGSALSLIPVITPYTSEISTPEIAGFTEVSSNSFRAHIRLQSTAALTNSAFSVIVFGN
jgi:hypothetical protein